MSLAIDRLEQGGTGAEIGLEPGDRVVTVNGHVVRDPLEWRYLVADEALAIEVDRGGTRLFFDVEKDFDDALGVELVASRFRTCNNRCIFCFVDQNPPKVRKALRLKDEDFRLSFLHGNYVTLTNTPPEDLDRIIEQRLSPMYVSVHATEPALRRMLLGNPRAPDILPIMRRLAEGRILMHAQVVLVPGINDSAHLDRTVDDLRALHPWVSSVAVVPVGLTRHRERLPALRRFLPDEAKALVAWQRRRQRRFLAEIGERFVYLSDEFTLVAGARVPSKRFYEGFPQVGNGVGMVRRFLDAFRRSLPRAARRSLPRVARPGLSQPQARNLCIDLVTGALAATFILPMVDRLNRDFPGITIRPHVVLNERYGHGVTVSGLLSGGDIAEALERAWADGDGRGDVVLLPPNVLNDDGLFLDDMSIAAFEDRVRVPVVAGSYDLVASVEEAAATAQRATPLEGEVVA